MTLVSKYKGKVYLVGAGPGDPQLISLRGLELIRRAEVVIYDYLANPQLLKATSPQAELIYVGKQAGRHTLSQQQITQLIVDKAKAGKLVVRLKGGDPFIFGRGGEEAEALADEGIAFEIVPGITSGVAVPAFAGIPLTHRDYTSSVAFFTGHEGEDKSSSAIHWDKIATGVGTLVFLMGVGNLEYIVSQLMKYGREPQTPVALIRWGSTPEQQTLVGTLENIAAKAKRQRLTPPAIIVVGEVVGLRNKLNWFEHKPLFGKGVVVTRSRTQASQLSAQLAELGARVFEFPAIQVEPADSYRQLDAALENLSGYDWLIFTSVNGVEYFLKRLRENGGDIRELKGIKLCAIGPATARVLEELELRIDYVPAEYRAEAIIAGLRQRGIKGQRVLIPRAESAREILPEELAGLGAEVEVVPAYKTVRASGNAEELRQLFKEKRVQLVTFTSSSTVNNFVELLGKDDLSSLMGGVVIASIGPITAKTAEKHGLISQIVPREYTIPALVEAIGEWFNKS
jgi:uroporphyrinogen III methyltransferase/synthase